jgi:hypothetical protein
MKIDQQKAYPWACFIVLGGEDTTLLQSNMGIEVTQHGCLIGDVFDTAGSGDQDLASMPRKDGNLSS